MIGVYPGRFSTIHSMNPGLVDIYRAFADMTRLRIVYLLSHQPLSVGHLQEALGLPQVNTSQHLAYLRKAGVVEFEAFQTWKIYNLRVRAWRELEMNLGVLQQCVKNRGPFDQDLRRPKHALEPGRLPDCLRQEMRTRNGTNRRPTAMSS